VVDTNNSSSMKSKDLEEEKEIFIKDLLNYSTDKYSKSFENPYDNNSCFLKKMEK
jgi:hypothetical protein